MDVSGLGGAGLDAVSRNLFEDFVNTSRSFETGAHRGATPVDTLKDMMKLQSNAFIMMSIASMPRSLINNLKN